MQYIVCYDEADGLFTLNSFVFNRSSDFVSYLRKLPQQSDWFDETSGSWNNEDQVNFAQVLTRNGLGYTFNVLEASDMLNLNKTSTDFR